MRLLMIHTFNMIGKLTVWWGLVSQTWMADPYTSMNLRDTQVAPAPAAAAVAEEEEVCT